MTINYIKLYLISVTAFLALDGVWLGAVARKFYADKLGKLMTDNVKWAAAGLFYALFVGLLIYFVIAPAIKADSLRMALERGALFGLATYATYDLTNYATLKNFPGVVVAIDMVWGVVLSLAVSGISFAIYKRL